MLHPSLIEASSEASTPTGPGSAVMSSLLLLLAVGCGDVVVERPPIIWEGQHIRFGTDADLELCAGTLSYLDGVAGHLGEVLQQPGVRVDYYWLPDGVEAFCNGDTTIGCALDGREAFSTLPIHQHELVHALRRPQLLYLPLEEGLAEAYGDDWEPIFPVSGDIEYLLREYDRGRKVPGSAYPLAGHFVSYLRAEHGADSLLALDRATDHSDSFASVESAFREVYGVDLMEEMDRYKATYPRCNQTFYRDLAFDCSRNVVEAPVQPDVDVEVAVSMSCDDPTVLGPRFDQHLATVNRWTTVTLDVQVPGLYFVFAGKADGDDVWPIRVRECEASCFDERSILVNDAPFIYGQMCLERGRYLFRFTEDSDFDDYQLNVTMVDSSC